MLDGEGDEQEATYSRVQGAKNNHGKNWRHKVRHRRRRTLHRVRDRQLCCESMRRKKDTKVQVRQALR
ncbi:hypothetical protein M413DRAFT_442107 [Hebeloma cylindrosporum]|uniref:Uncharacterized protein n=1 Tax=Hebeloma cylindrosporum TaxID=76867 RepID=A0A0C3CMS9_HEBCY|nr:hypothetical protein M413DRAFT_442107 [Hebeloma cylindrosporum h7]